LFFYFFNNVLLSMKYLKAAVSCFDQAQCDALPAFVVVGKTKCNQTMRESGGDGTTTLLCRTTAKPRAGEYPVVVKGMFSQF
jgi:hypothetical protein